MRGQSVASGVSARVARGNGCLQRVGAERTAQRRGTAERGKSAADQQPIPAGTILLQQQHRLAGRTDPCPGA